MCVYLKIVTVTINFFVYFTEQKKIVILLYSRKIAPKKNQCFKFFLKKNIKPTNFWEIFCLFIKIKVFDGHLLIFLNILKL